MLKNIRQSYIDYLHNEQYKSYIIKYFKNRLGSTQILSLTLFTIVLFYIFAYYKNESEKYFYGYIYDHNVISYNNYNYGIQHVKYVDSHVELICTIKHKFKEDYNTTKDLISNYNSTSQEVIHLTNNLGLCEISSIDTYNELLSNLSFYHGTLLLFGSLMFLYYCYVIINNFGLIKSYIKNKFKKKDINDISIELIEDVIRSSEQIKRYIFEHNEIMVTKHIDHDHSV